MRSQQVPMSQFPRDTWGRFDASGCLTCAVPPTSVQFVAYLTLATEQAGEVVASSKNTDVREGALINILKKG